MKDLSGFSMLNQPMAFICRVASCADRAASKLASLTNADFGSRPPGNWTDLKRRALAYLSCLLALLNVLQGGAKCNHLTFFSLMSFFNFLKCPVFLKSKLTVASLSLTSTAQRLQLSALLWWVQPHLQTALRMWPLSELPLLPLICLQTYIEVELNSHAKILNHCNPKAAHAMLPVSISRVA